jgi:hypothetical protein
MAHSRRGSTERNALVAAVELQAAALVGDLPAAERLRHAGHGSPTSAVNHVPRSPLLLDQLSGDQVLDN